MIDIKSGSIKNLTPVFKNLVSLTWQDCTNRTVKTMDKQAPYLPIRFQINQNVT